MRYISIQFKQFMLHFFKEAYLSPESRKTIFRRHIYCKREQVPDSSSSSISTFKSQQQEKQQTTLSTFTSTKQLRHTTVVVKTPTMQAVKQTGQADRDRDRETVKEAVAETLAKVTHCLCSCCRCCCRKKGTATVIVPCVVCLPCCVLQVKIRKYALEKCLCLCLPTACTKAACLPAWLPGCLRRCFCPGQTDPHWLLSSASPTQQTHE